MQFHIVSLMHFCYQSDVIFKTEYLKFGNITCDFDQLSLIIL